MGVYLEYVTDACNALFYDTLRVYLPPGIPPVGLI
jgi:hypothetical protein